MHFYKYYILLYSLTLVHCFASSLLMRTYIFPSYSSSERNMPTVSECHSLVNSQRYCINCFLTSIPFLIASIETKAWLTQQEPLLPSHATSEPTHHQFLGFILYEILLLRLYISPSSSSSSSSSSSNNNVALDTNPNSHKCLERCCPCPKEKSEDSCATCV